MSIDYVHTCRGGQLCSECWEKAEVSYPKRDDYKAGLYRAADLVSRSGCVHASELAAAIRGLEDERQ